MIRKIVRTIWKILHIKGKMSIALHAYAFVMPLCRVQAFHEHNVHEWNSSLSLFLWLQHNRNKDIAEKQTSITTLPTVIVVPLLHTQCVRTLILHCVTRTPMPHRNLLRINVNVLMLQSHCFTHLVHEVVQ